MNNIDTFNISEEDKKEALASLRNAPSMSVEEAVTIYKNDLNNYCAQFKASSNLELMSRADELEFGFQVSSEILEKYSFVERHQS